MTFTMVYIFLFWKIEHYSNEALALKSIQAKNVSFPQTQTGICCPSRSRNVLEILQTILVKENEPSKISGRNNGTARHVSCKFHYCFIMNAPFVLQRRYRNYSRLANRSQFRSISNWNEQVARSPHHSWNTNWVGWAGNKRESGLGLVMLGPIARFV